MGLKGKFLGTQVLDFRETHGGEIQTSEDTSPAPVG